MMDTITKFQKIFSHSLLLAMALVLIFSSSASALTAQQRAVFDSGIYYFDLVTACGPVSTGDRGVAGAIVGEDNAEKIWNYFKAKGLTNEQVAGIMGNISQESNYSPTRRQGSGDLWNDRYENNAWGLVQWDGSRRFQTPDGGVLGKLRTDKPHLLQYVEDYGARGADQAILESNPDHHAELLLFSLDYVYFEMTEGARRGVWDAIKATTTIEDALIVFHDQFEGSADTREQVISNRGAMAQEAFANFASSDCGISGNIVMPVVVEGAGKFGVPYGEPFRDVYDFHKGIDISNTSDGSVLAMSDGEVIGIDPTFDNNAVKIRHADGLVTTYLHMEMRDIVVSVGDTVTAGQKIGTMGESGQAWGIHLHFELILDQLSEDAKPKYAEFTQDSNRGRTTVNPDEFLKRYASNYPW